MEREILFKGKRTDNGEWVEGYLIKIDTRCFIFNEEDFGYYNDWGCLDGYLIKIDTKTLSQFTGLLDKNGNKIFENDVARVITLDAGIPIIYIVKFGKFEDINSYEDDSIFLGWYIQNIKNGDKYSLVQDDEIFSKLAEIVGNKFDNPELLGE